MSLTFLTDGCKAEEDSTAKVNRSDVNVTEYSGPGGSLVTGALLTPSACFRVRALPTDGGCRGGQ